jgi:hypothetical protein
MSGCGGADAGMLFGVGVVLMTPVCELRKSGAMSAALTLSWTPAHVFSYVESSAWTCNVDAQGQGHNTLKSTLTEQTGELNSMKK